MHGNLKRFFIFYTKGKASYTNKTKKSFMFDGASVWNSLPQEIRESKSLSSLKNKIATHAFDAT
jgi:hypothetical protein